MEPLTYRLFLHQWPRKLLALLAAIIIWFFVNHSIISTKTLNTVPIRITNLPVDKTIQGLLPNGFLSKRATLTLSGTKDIIDQLEPGDLEVVLDVSNQLSEGSMQITKKNLVSLNPNINLMHHITSISHSEVVIKMSSLLTEKIPVTIHPPSGQPPKGYSFVDIWPVKLTHTITGPQEQVLHIKNSGLHLAFNLNDITKEQLDALLDSSHSHNNEISFSIPDNWKKVSIPFFHPLSETLNDPDAKSIEITFLRDVPLPIKQELPLRIFYPLRSAVILNLHTHPLAQNEWIELKHDIPVLTIPLFCHHVSKAFLDIVKDNIEIDITAAPKTERDKLEWSTGFIDDRHLENTYVAFMLSEGKQPLDKTGIQMKERENYFRQRFRFYKHQLALCSSSKGEPLELECTLEDECIAVQIPHISSNSYSKHDKP